MLVRRAPQKRVLERYPGCAGCDEAGRGPLAGPVVGAAVMLPENFDISGLNDSKKLDASQREALEERIVTSAVYAIEFAWPPEIDSKNILWASIAAMGRAVDQLFLVPELVYVDGNRAITTTPMPCIPVIKGDGKIAEIAAASILAKTARDRYMVSIAAEYPGYGFERHFGYPTPEHLEALRRLGPCQIHRASFAPVAELLQPGLF
jgi:ribonuclease HII